MYVYACEEEEEEKKIGNITRKKTATIINKPMDYIIRLIRTLNAFSSSSSFSFASTILTSCATCR